MILTYYTPGFKLLKSIVMLRNLPVKFPIKAESDYQ